MQPDSTSVQDLAQRVRVTLPAARPDDYLSWMAWWREVETMMLERPALEAVGSGEAAPFLRGDVARLMSDAVHQVTAQATDALAEGQASIAPTVEVPASAALLNQIADYMELRGNWLASFARSIAIEPPPDHIQDLRGRTIDLYRERARELAESEGPLP